MAHPLRFKRQNYLERLPENVKLVARPSRYGNPFKVGDHGTQAEVVDAYREWITAPEQAALLQQARQQLRGCRLACYCSLDAPCHADVLCELVNAPASPQSHATHLS